MLGRPEVCRFTTTEEMMGPKIGDNFPETHLSQKCAFQCVFSAPRGASVSLKNILFAHGTVLQFSHTREAVLVLHKLFPRNYGAACGFSVAPSTGIDTLVLSV